MNFGDRPQQGAESCDDERPALAHWVHSSTWLRFKSWTQEWLNASASGNSPPVDFGSLTLVCPSFSGDLVHLVAQSVELEDPGSDLQDFKNEDDDSIEDD